ncbi:MAG: SPOR domain-containing protein [Atribacterota bacterium]|nr:SPOR domain-containing protein [Atribacterota bacterium]
MRRSRRIYKRKSRSNLETLIILVGAIVILSVAFYMAREKSFLPPEDMKAEQNQSFEEDIAERSDADQKTIEELLAQRGETQGISAEELTLGETDAEDESPVHQQDINVGTEIQDQTPQQLAQQDSIVQSPQPVIEREESHQDQRRVTEPASGQAYTVQVGFFSVENNARSLAKEIEGHGYDTFVVPQNGNYKVQVGSYQTQEQAERASQQLKNLGYEIWVTRK